MTKQPTTRTISGLLRRAGHTRSTSSSTRVRGVRDYSRGYVVLSHREGVSVEHRTGGFLQDETQEAAALAEYRKVIEAAGYTVAVPPAGLVNRLIVTAAAAAPASNGPYMARDDTRQSAVRQALDKVSAETWREFDERMQRKDQVRREAVFGPLEASGVELGDYDRTALEQVTERLEPDQLASLTGIIQRALAAIPPSNA